jgi:hypothetical protein
LCIPHQSLMMRQSGQWASPRHATLLKIALSSSPHDSQETGRLDEDSQCSSIVDDCVSPTPPSQVLALTWQCYMWLHVASAILISLHIIPVNVTCLPVFGTY